MDPLGEDRIIRKAVIAAVVVALVACVPATAPAQVQPYQANDYGGFHSILPPGTNGTFSATDFAQFQLLGTYPPHANDQLSMYENLVYATPGPDRGADPELLQERQLRRACRTDRADVQPARGRHDRARLELRHGARLRRDTLRHDLRRGVCQRRGPPVLHGRAAPRRPRAAVRLRGWREQGDGRRRVVERALQRGRPAGADRQGRRLLRSRGRRAPAGPRRLRRGHQPVHLRGPDRSHEAALRVRRDRQDAGGLAGHRRDRDRSVDRRDLRQGRRQRARQRAWRSRRRRTASGALPASRRGATSAARTTRRRPRP